MRSAASGVILGWVILATACPPLCADGGSLRLSAVQGGYRISVFTAPTPFRQGAVDVSVLVQDRDTGQPMPLARVSVCMTKPGHRTLSYPATHDAATNKLFRAAQFELPASGRWELEVQVEGLHGMATIGGEVEAAAPLPRWRELWMWIGWPAVAIALFGIHRVLVHRKA
jgi:transposase